jgi:hypothetical protein
MIDTTKLRHLIKLIEWEIHLHRVSAEIQIAEQDDRFRTRATLLNAMR